MQQHLPASGGSDDYYYYYNFYNYYYYYNYYYFKCEGAAALAPGGSDGDETSPGEKLACAH